MDANSRREQTVAKRVAEDKAKLLEQFRKMPVIQQAVRNAGLGRTTYYDWCKRDAKFSKAAAEAIREGTHLMNEIAETQLLSLIKEKKFGPIAFWLTHRHPAYASKLELSGTVTTKESPMTAERKALLWKALRYSAMYGKKRTKN